MGTYILSQPLSWDCAAICHCAYELFALPSVAILSIWYHTHLMMLLVVIDDGFIICWWFLNYDDRIIIIIW
jgi:hypothetical protein